MNANTTEFKEKTQSKNPFGVYEQEHEHEYVHCERYESEQIWIFGHYLPYTHIAIKYEIALNEMNGDILYSIIIIWGFEWDWTSM